MDAVEKILAHRHVRPTAMRLLVYKFLAAKERAVTLTDIENAFVKSDRTTLYRTIKTFSENGIVHQIEDGTGVAKFALCEDGCNCDIENDLHLHFHCNVCNQTQCLTDRKIPQIKLPAGYKAIDVNLVVKGVCNTCNDN